MARILKLYFISVICLLSINSPGQQIIPFTKSNKCDSTLMLYHTIKFEMGNLQCIKAPGKDQVIYFTKIEEFQDYIHQNKVSIGYCSDKPEMMFDFNKFDVVLVWVEFNGGKDSYLVIEKNDSFVINLNYFLKKYYEGDTIKRYENNLMSYYYSHYFLLPKGKVNVPEFHIYETFYECF